MSRRQNAKGTSDVAINLSSCRRNNSDEINRAHLQIDELQMLFQVWQTEELCKQDAVGADAGIIEKCGKIERNFSFIAVARRCRVQIRGRGGENV